MNRTFRALVPLLGVALLVAACGGSGSQATGSAGPIPGSSVAPSNAASVEPTVQPTDDDGGTGGGSACDLLTAAEAAKALGVASTTTEPLDGEPSYCTYRDPEGKAVLSTVLQQSGGRSLFVTFETAEDAIVVPGLGDKAVFSESWLGTLFILKADRLYNLAGGSTSDMEARREVLAALGAIAVGRM
jgi:hypothetical protein